MKVTFRSMVKENNGIKIRMSQRGDERAEDERKEKTYRVLFFIFVLQPRC